MAVKKATKKDEVVVEETIVEVEETATETEIDTEIDEVEEVTETEVETPEVEVETQTEVEIEEPTEKDVEVTVKDTVVDNTKKPLGKVKIRMRVDHKCCIAMERYDLKAGKVYTVPVNVKYILNKAGLLSPI